MNSPNDFEIIRNIESNIDLVKTDDELIPYNLLVMVVKEDDMKSEPPEPYFIPTNQKGTEGIDVARRIKLGIYKRVYPDTWEIRHIHPEDRFAKNEPLSESSAGYHYVRFKAPSKTKKYPSFEARVYNPSTRRMAVIASFPFGQPYSGESLETAFYKACIEVDKFYGNPEKSFRTYIDQLDRNKVDKESYEKVVANEKEELQESLRLTYLRKYLVSDATEKKPSENRGRKNLFVKKKEEEFCELKGHYPYVYISKKDDKFVLSAVVPEFEDHHKCTLGTFTIDEKSYKSTWKQLAKLVDGHFKRQIKADGYYDNLAPSFEALTKNIS